MTASWGITGQWGCLRVEKCWQGVSLRKPSMLPGAILLWGRGEAHGFAARRC